MACVPDQSPEALQVVASLVVQVIELPDPGATTAGAALIMTVGAGTVVTVTVVLVEAVPPVPLQERVKVAVAAGVTLAVPLVAMVPLQPPDAVQEVALVEVHVSVALPPTVIDVGLALIETVGAGATVTVVLAEAVPPAPVQSSV